MRDDVFVFTNGPAAFILQNPIVLSTITDDLPGGIPPVDNLRTRFTLSTVTQGGTPAPGALPCLRMQPVGGPEVVPQPGGGVLTTIDALYCRASDGGTPLANVYYCDVPIQPAPNDAHCLFTTGMNGCSLIVLSAAPQGAPPLAANHFRVVHDHDHRDLNTWAAVGATVRFAAYDDPNQAGIVPPGWAPPTLANYNPNNYAYGVPVPGKPFPGARVVTNFLYWTGLNWTFNSRHYTDYTGESFDIDAVPPNIAASTASMNI